MRRITGAQLNSFHLVAHKMAGAVYYQVRCIVSRAAFITMRWRMFVPVSHYIQRRRS